MGPLAYYFPGILGFLLPFGLQEMIFSQPAIAALPPWGQWAALVAISIDVAVSFQLVMIGAQGFLAQVVPVPFGRSIRGGWAATIGLLLIATVVLSGAAALLYVEGFATAAMIGGAGGLASLVAAALAYVWSLPIAERDFAAR